MGAFEELRSGQLGSETVSLLYRTVAAVARFGRFPPPEGAERWDASAVQEVAHDFILRDGKQRLAKLMVLAVDELSLERLLESAVRNHLRDLSRQTARGRLSRAVANRLEQMPQVVKLGGSGSGAIWMSDGADPSGAAPPPDALVQATFDLEGVVAARAVVTPRRGKSMIEPASLEAVLLRTLSVAGCPLDQSTLLEVVMARFPVVADHSHVSLDDASAKALGSHDPDLLAVAETVDDIWAQLQFRERLVLWGLDPSVSVRSLADELGLSKSSVQRALTRARAVVESNLERAEDRELVVGELLRRSSRTGPGTDPGASASFSTGGGA